MPVPVRCMAASLHTKMSYDFIIASYLLAHPGLKKDYFMLHVDKNNLINFTFIKIYVKVKSYQKFTFFIILISILPQLFFLLFQNVSSSWKNSEEWRGIIFFSRIC